MERETTWKERRHGKRDSLKRKKERIKMIVTESTQKTVAVHQPAAEHQHQLAPQEGSANNSQLTSNIEPTQTPAPHPIVSNHEENLNQCAICMEKLSKVRVELDCGHRFDSSCLTEFICLRIEEGKNRFNRDDKNRVYINCPLCRGPIDNAYGKITQSLAVFVKFLHEELPDKLSALEKKVEKGLISAQRAQTAPQYVSAIQKATKPLLKSTNFLTNMINTTSEGQRLDPIIKVSIIETLSNFQNAIKDCNQLSLSQSDNDTLDEIQLTRIKEAIAALDTQAGETYSQLRELLPDVYQPHSP